MAQFKKIYYRIVDSLGDDDEFKERMLEIEDKTYNVIIGGLKEEDVDKKNKLADHAIAKAIHTSLRVYEASRKKFEVSYFKFK